MKENNNYQTDPKAILTMLDDVHIMQRNGVASALTVHYNPVEHTLRVKMLVPRGERYTFLISSTTDIDTNLEAFRQLKRKWLTYERQILQSK